MKELSKDRDIYFTIEEEKEFELVIKKSKFIAQVFPINTQQKADGLLEVIRKKHYNANHNCFAYVIGQNGLEFRFSDDGEPPGTAGKPILFMLNKYEFKDVILIVTRYFGGTRLGIGPLSRAYSDAAAGVLEKCKKKPIYISEKIKIFCGYEDISAVKRILDDYSLSNQEEYADSIEIISEIPVSLVDEFRSIIIDKTSGRAGTLKVQ